MWSKTMHENYEFKIASSLQEVKELSESVQAAPCILRKIVKNSKNGKWKKQQFSPFIIYEF